jgi:hypothetical protein
MTYITLTKNFIRFEYANDCLKGEEEYVNTKGFCSTYLPGT